MPSCTGPRHWTHKPGFGDLPCSDPKSHILRTLRPGDLQHSGTSSPLQHGDTAAIAGDRLCDSASSPPPKPAPAGPCASRATTMAPEPHPAQRGWDGDGGSPLRSLDPSLRNERPCTQPLKNLPYNVSQRLAHIKVLNHHLMNECAKTQNFPPTFFCLFRVALSAYGGSQARGRIGAVATSHSNAGSKPRL